MKEVITDILSLEYKPSTIAALFNSVLDSKTSSLNATLGTTIIVTKNFKRFRLTYKYKTSIIETFGNSTIGRVMQITKSVTLTRSKLAALTSILLLKGEKDA